MKNLILTLFLLAVPVLVFGEDLTETDMATVHKSSCRVRCFKKGSNSGSIGSGVVCAKSDSQYLVLTNNHVVDGCNTFQCDWFNTGKPVSAPAQLIKKFYYNDGTADFAFLVVNRSDLNGYEPPVIPLAKEGTKPEEGSRIIFSGCSEGRWAACWVGTIRDYFGTTAQFTPAPKPGQSGSSLVQNIDNELVITAVLTWRIGDEKNSSEEKMLGGAIPVKNLWIAMSGKKPTGDGKNIPENALPVARSENIPENAEYAIIHTEDKQLFRRELFFFTGRYCPPCRQAEEIILKELKKNPEWIIRELIAEKDEDKKYFEAYNVSQTPTFIVVEIEEGKITKIVERWTGFTNDLAERLEKLLNIKSKSFSTEDLADKIHERILKEKQKEKAKTLVADKPKDKPKPVENQKPAEKQKPELVVKSERKQIDLPVIPDHFPRDYLIENGKVNWDMTRFQSDLYPAETGSETGSLDDFLKPKTQQEPPSPKPDTEEGGLLKRRETPGPIGGAIDRGLDKISGSAEKVISEKLEVFKADFFKYFDQIRNKIIFYGSLIFAGIMTIGYIFGGAIIKICQAISSKLPKIQFVKKE